MKKRLLLLLLILSLALLLPGCAAQEAQMEEHVSYIYAMDTVITLTAYSNLEGVDEVLARISGAIESLEDRISVTDENSEIYMLNESSDTPMEMSQDTIDITSRALDICASTHGVLDISIYPIVREWGFTTGSYKVPNYNDLMRMLNRVDYTKVIIDGSTISVSPGMQIDLGSVAKGYVGDMAADMLKEAGVESATLNLGGNVRALGTNTDGKPWRVGVQDPLDESSYFGIISVEDKSVVTSGGYNRYFEEAGQTYWHIIDPFSGYPADSGVISATIIGTDGLMCDGLSTATFIMGVNDAFDYWRGTGGFDMLLVTENGNIYITPGLEDSFELLPAYESQYNVEVVH